MASGLGVTVLSNLASIANGIEGVGVIVGVFETRGVNVTVGLSVMVGVKLIVGVSVIVGVNVGVWVGGKTRYKRGSAWLLIRKINIIRMIEANNSRHPRTICCRRMRKNLKLRAERIEYIPRQINRTVRRDRIRMAVITPVRMSRAMWAGVWYVPIRALAQQQQG